MHPVNQQTHKSVDSCESHASHSQPLDALSGQTYGKKSGDFRDFRAMYCFLLFIIISLKLSIKPLGMVPTIVFGNSQLVTKCWILGPLFIAELLNNPSYFKNTFLRNRIIENLEFAGTRVRQIVGNVGLCKFEIVKR